MNKILLTIITSLIIDFSNLQTLHYVQQISRHGARTPISSIYDPFHTDWGIELGQLTPSGMRQHYLIGHQFNRRYNSQNGALFQLYNQTYNPLQVYIQASNVNRTIVSAFSQLSGLFPPGARSNLTSAQSYNARPPFKVIDSQTAANLGDHVVDQNYQIVPIHTFAKSVDPLRDDWCPEFRYQSNLSKTTQEYKRLQDSFNQTDSSVLAKMARLLNMSRSDVTIEYAKQVRDALIARKFNGFDIGDFNNFFNQIDQMGAQWYYFTMTYNNELLKIINTNFFTHTMQFFNQTIQSAITGNSETEKNRLKFVFFSYHDDQQLQLCAGLGIGDVQHKWPPYASTIVHQLWHDDTFDPKTTCKTIEDCLDQFYVKVKYNDEVFQIPNQCKTAKTFGDQYSACSLREWWTHIKANVIYTGTQAQRHQVCFSHVRTQQNNIQHYVENKNGNEKKGFLPLYDPQVLIE